jgi:hypothetical protein
VPFTLIKRHPRAFWRVKSAQPAQRRLWGFSGCYPRYRQKKVSYLDAWIGVLKFAIGTGIAGFVARSLFSQYLTRDIERFKVELATRHSQEIEQLKADLHAEETVHERLHERRLVVIDEAYARLAAADIAFRLALAPQGWGVVDENRQDLSGAKDKAKAFIQYFEGKRIYFDDGLCELVDKMDVSFSRATAGLSALAESGEADQQLKYKSWSEFTNTIGPLRQQLENRAREILGVSKRS